MTPRQKLIMMLRAKSYMYCEEMFTLASGKKSHHYVNCKKVLYNSYGLNLATNLIWDRILTVPVTAVGGMSTGADPLAIGLIVKLPTLSAFSVRQAPKEYGDVGALVGAVKPGDKALVVEDVVTTGGSTLRAVDTAEMFGLEVVKVIALVDREEGGMDAIRELVPDAEALVTLGEIIG